MIERTLRFGVVGRGRIVGNHLRALASDHGPAELVAVADIQAEGSNLSSSRLALAGACHGKAGAHP